METPQQSSNARLLAIIALVAVFVVLMVVIVTSLGGDSGSSHRGARPQSTAKTQKQSSSRKTYVVKPGDSFSVIAQKVGISVERLQKLNPHIDQFTLQSGDRVKLR